MFEEIEPMEFAFDQRLIRVPGRPRGINIPIPRLWEWREGWHLDYLQAKAAGPNPRPTIPPPAQYVPREGEETADSVETLIPAVPVTQGGYQTESDTSIPSRESAFDAFLAYYVSFKGKIVDRLTGQDGKLDSLTFGLSAVEDSLATLKAESKMTRTEMATNSDVLAKFGGQLNQIEADSDFYFNRTKTIFDLLSSLQGEVRELKRMVGGDSGYEIPRRVESVSVGIQTEEEMEGPVLDELAAEFVLEMDGVPVSVSEVPIIPVAASSAIIPISEPLLIPTDSLSSEPIIEAGPTLDDASKGPTD